MSRAQVHMDLAVYQGSIDEVLAPLLDHPYGHYDLIIEKRQGLTSEGARQLADEILRNHDRRASIPQGLVDRLRAWATSPPLPHVLVHGATIVGRYDRCGMSHPGDD